LDLSQVLGQLPVITDKNVLVSAANADDAGVYRISDDTAVVLTADFFTPVVDDPYMFGAIAAANSLSDVYAMGARPVVSLNLAAFPDNPDFFPSLKKIMEGGVAKMSEAGVSIIGGHTIRDKEPKFGFAVLGLINPDNILDNTCAKPGDALILTKKIGTGIISTGIRGGMCGDEVIKEITASMAALNRRAGEIMLEVGVSTSTDITGFGLIGHLFEVLTASNCCARLYSDRIPFFREAFRLADKCIVPAGTVANSRSFSPHVKWGKDISDNMRLLLNDAQTSGGLLIFVPLEKSKTLTAALESEGILAAHIGETQSKGFGDNKIISVE
jgi:selenium donor protein